jgi:hypothetical protein
MGNGKHDPRSVSSLRCVELTDDINIQLNWLIPTERYDEVGPWYKLDTSRNQPKPMQSELFSCITQSHGGDVAVHCRCDLSCPVTAQLADSQLSICETSQSRL